MTLDAENQKRIDIGTGISQMLIPRMSRPEVGKRLGISSERVRQIETLALFKLQKRLKEKLGYME